MADSKKKTVTRTMKVTMTEEEFQKFDQGLTHSSRGVRTDDGKLSALPDIAPLDPAEDKHLEKELQEIMLERQKQDFLERTMRANQRIETLESIGVIIHGIESLTAFLADHPEIVRAGIRFGRKARDTVKSSYSKMRSLGKKQPVKPQLEAVPGNPEDATFEVELLDEQQERIPITEEQAARLLTNMREEAKKLAAMMYLWSVITIKDEKNESEYTLEQSYIKELLNEDAHKTIEMLVSNRDLLDESTAQTLSDFLDGYLTADGRRIPIPVMIGKGGNDLQDDNANGASELC